MDDGYMMRWRGSWYKRTASPNPAGAYQVVNTCMKQFVLVCSSVPVFTLDRVGGVDNAHPQAGLV